MRLSLEETLEIKVESDAKRNCVIGKCAMCGSRIWTNSRRVKIHGYFVCSKHELSERVFEFERLINSTGRMSLVCNSEDRKTRKEPEEKKPESDRDIVQKIIDREESG
jgi:hypothetical protein